MKKPMILNLVLALIISACKPDSAELPMAYYSGGVQGSASLAHDGGLAWTAGVQNVQVVRSVPADPGLGDGASYTIRHHPFINYWDGYFWIFHMGNKSLTRDQSKKEGRLQWSENGFDWDQKNSAVIFPGGTCTHLRMAFYTASNGVLLVSSWMSKGEEYRGQMGSRLVRRIKGPNNFGDIFTVRHNLRGGFASYHMYTESPDLVFREACEELLANKLYRQQWQEEDIDENFYIVNNSPDGKEQVKAFAWYTRDNGQIMGFFKGMLIAASMDWDFGKVQMVSESVNWEDGKLTSYNMFGLHGSSKCWAQKTQDGRFAVAGNSAGELFKRWPLVVSTSEDGLNFNTPYSVIAGDFGPQRYPQPDYDNKDAGLQYVRGICEGNGNPEDGYMWLTYSHNKEDIWIAAVPVPIKSSVEGNVSDDFEALTTSAGVPGWNIHSPLWAPVGIIKEGDTHFMRLQDKDPFDYAKSFRMFPESGNEVKLSFRMRPGQTRHGRLEVDIVEPRGRVPIRLIFDDRGSILAGEAADSVRIGSYHANKWMEINISADVNSGKYNITLDGKTTENLGFMERVSNISRLEFRTGTYRLKDFTRRAYRTSKEPIKTYLDGADKELPVAYYDIDDVIINSLQ